MTAALRIALCVNPFTLEGVGGDHAPSLARELLGRGHIVRGFGASPGAIPRSSAVLDEAGEPVEASAPGVVGFAPHLVVGYEVLSPAAFMGARAARRLDVPLVLVEPGAAGRDAWHKRFLRGVGERLWGPYVRRSASVAVAVDDPSRERVLAEGFPGERVHVLPGGVDPLAFRPGLVSGLIAQHAIRGRILLYAGRFDERRGLETLIEAFAATVGQRADWSLVLAGEGPLKRVLRARVDRLGIGARVHWLPRPRAEELPGLMGASTLLAVPATDPLVRSRQILRAMACGLPVLASDLPRFHAYVEDGQTGLLLRPGELASWTAGLSRAAGAPEARKRWSRRAREVVEERLSWQRLAERFEALFGAVLEEHARAAGDERSDGRARASA